jgi:hypothetical protein
VLEQVADVIVAQRPGERAAARERHCELEIHERRATVRRHQPVGLLGKIVVNDFRGVQAT